MISTKLRCSIGMKRRFNPVCFVNPYTSGNLSLSGIMNGSFLPISSIYPYTEESINLSNDHIGYLGPISSNYQPTTGTLSVVSSNADNFDLPNATALPYPLWQGLSFPTLTNWVYSGKVGWRQGTTDGSLFTGGIQANSNTWVQAKVIGLSSTLTYYHRLILGAFGENGYYFLGVRAGGFQIGVKINSNFYYILNSYTYTVNEGDVIKFSVDNSSNYSVYVNGSLVVTQHNDTGHQSPGLYPGLWINSSASYFDNFSCGMN